MTSTTLPKLSVNGNGRHDRLDFLGDWLFICHSDELVGSVARATDRGLDAIVWPGGKRPRLDVADKKIIIVSAADKASLKLTARIKKQCEKDGASIVRPWILDGLGIEFPTFAEWSEQFTLEQVLWAMAPWKFDRGVADEPAEPAPTEDKPTDPDEKQPQVIMRLAAQAEFFHDPENRAYARFSVKEHREVHAVQSHGFRLWLKHQFYKEQGRPPSSQAFQDVLSLLEARAFYDGKEEAVHIRVAGDADRIFVDLGEETWRVVEITAEGWDFKAEAPVCFRRTSGQRPLPPPVRGGNIGLLADFINCKYEDFVLIVAWLGAALRPAGPYPVLVLTGEQGSAKSSSARALRKLIDNHISLIRAAPEKERDLAVSASNGHVFALDNLSSIPLWLSDALCRLATGGGIANRTHYTMDEETYLDSQRPIILTGIEDFVTRGDLISRSLPIHLPAIEDGRRKTEKAFWAEFDAAAPLLVGALFDLVANAMRILPKISISTMPRMADFALFGEAISRAMGNPPDTFIGHYGEARFAADQSAVEDSSVASALKTLIEREVLPLDRTAAELLKLLSEIAGEKESSSRSWPKTPRGMSGALRRLAPLLRKTENIHLEFDRANKKRSIVIGRVDAI